MIRRIEQKKEKRKKILMGFVLVFLMVVSLLGVLLYNNNGGTNIEYNGQKFTHQDNTFITTINGQKQTFFFLPQSLLSIPKPNDLTSILSSQSIKITFNPEYNSQELSYLDLIRQDFSQNLPGIVESGVTSPSNIYSFPVITCEDNGTIVLFNQSNETSITKNDNCIVFNAQGAEFLKLRDLSLYTIYGILN